MTLTTFFKRARNNRITRKATVMMLWPMRLTVRSIAAKSGPRTMLNQYYNQLGARAKSRFQSRYSRIFRQENISMSPGEWNVHFAGRRIRLPLRPSWAWLDWDLAVSTVGHDSEVVQTYEAIIASDQRPVFFLDVGANYGTHSVLFLSAGIPVISFEPNPRCCEYFQVASELNDLSGRWEQVAVGSEAGEIELVFPEKETWIGSVSPDVISELKKSGDVSSLRVPVRNLDHYLNDIPHGKLLIKIDVEGYEGEVLKGASRMLRDRRPVIIFESNDAKARGELFRLLDGSGYRIHSLPWRPSAHPQALSLDKFMASSATNFIAVPAD